jgi:hypothetical protein
MAEKTQNGWAEPEKRLIDDGPREMMGGGGDQGLNSLGLPYATSAVGSGPEILVKETNKARRGMSLDGNFERGRKGADREYDRITSRS